MAHTEPCWGLRLAEFSLLNFSQLGRLWKERLLGTQPKRRYMGSREVQLAWVREAILLATRNARNERG